MSEYSAARASLAEAETILARARLVLAETADFMLQYPSLFRPELSARVALESDCARNAEARIRDTIDTVRTAQNAR